MGQEITMAEAISSCDPIITNGDMGLTTAFDGKTPLI